MALAFRYVTDTDPLQLKLSTKLMCSDMAHVDLLFNVPCEGKHCTRRGLHHISPPDEPKPKHAKGKTHIIAYSIRNTAASNTVACTVHPAFYKDCAWAFVGINVTNVQFQIADQFMRTQLGGGYNMKGYRLNWITGWCGLATGTDYYEVTTGKVLTRKRNWFCSELVCAALINAGLITNEIDVHPCTTSPNALWIYFTHHPRAINFGLTTEDVWPDAPPLVPSAAATAAAATDESKTALLLK